MGNSHYYDQLTNIGELIDPTLDILLLVYYEGRAQVPDK